MPFSNVSTDAPFAVASTAEEIQQLYEQFSSQPGGGTIYLSSDFEVDGEIRLSGGGNNPVHITSANPNEPTDVSRIYFNDVQNVKVSGVAVDSTGVFVSDFEGDVDINNSSAIELSDIIFTSDGAELFDPRLASSVSGGRLGVITNSSDITISDTVASNYFNGWMLLESRDIVLEDNELFAIQGDGIKMREVQDVLIKDNYLHDFAFSPNEVNHSDFIQLHSNGATSASSGVTITGNVMETGNGSSVQAIWVGSSASFPHEDITITDNLIYTGSANGIGVSDAVGVNISNNTLLWNPEAETIKATGNTSFEPSIRTNDNVSDLTILDNIAPRYVLASSGTQSGNIDTSYTPGHANYVGDHFENVAAGGDIGFEDWQLQPDSPWVGTGASVSQPDGMSLEPAPLPDPQPEPEPQPEPQPGPQPSTTLYEADFEDGIVDLSGFDSSLQNASELNLVATPDGTGYEIGSGQMVRLDVDNEQIHSLDSFGFEMEITLLGTDDVGRFVHFPRAFEAIVERDGTVTFNLTTDEGSFSVNSGDAVLNDGATHLFAVGYDDTVGTLSMAIDGMVVGKADASGSTADGTHHGLTIGSIWGNSVDAIVDDIFLGTDPMEAGVDLSMDVGDTFSPTTVGPDASTNSFFGDEFDNFLIGSDQDDVMSGGDGDDALIGEEGDDTIDGGSGMDTLIGSSGNDRLLGGDGDDVIDGGSGDDTAAGGNSDDIVLGYDGDDSLDGGHGNDFLAGGNDQDTISGGEGDDSLFGQSGDDLLFGGNGNDTLLGDAGSDNLDGGADQDLVIGGEGNDLLTGGSGDDELIGGDGSDVLMGDSGNDILNGGSGSDILSGGIGADDFYFAGSGTEFDVISDFAISEDRIVLDISEFDSGFHGIEWEAIDNGESVAIRYLDSSGAIGADSGGIILEGVFAGSAEDITLVLF